MTRGQSVVHGVVALTIPAKAEYIVLSRLALSGLARARALEPALVADLKLALTEACSNVVRHAYKEQPAGEVEVRYELDEDKLSVEVVDEGIGFDPEAAAAAAGDELDEGGLGISIIRAIVDELDIKSGDSGSSLRFTKYLA
ncbi:MAG TPA: ATP-binding protein [Gaiellaceae bacterium]|jgi:serine/threonine-protein kinase RsbW|nr:ATP-binding protein [Gaiellaceae bacterium]